MKLDITLEGETLDLSAELLDRYNVPGPRYTSYPTAPEWHDDFGPADYERELGESNASGRPLSLYMHLPFCERLCLFCGCNVVIRKNHDDALPYLETLKREISQVARRVDRARPVVQFHWGAGPRPTFRPPSSRPCSRTRAGSSPSPRTRRSG